MRQRRHYQSIILCWNCKIIDKCDHQNNASTDIVDQLLYAEHPSSNQNNPQARIFVYILRHIFTLFIWMHRLTRAVLEYVSEVIITAQPGHWSCTECCGTVRNCRRTQVVALVIQIETQSVAKSSFIRLGYDTNGLTNDDKTTTNRVSTV